MSTSSGGLTTIGAGTMDAADLESRFTIIETWLNGGMIAGDLASGGWATPRYIFAPEFFGTPAPMTRMTFGDVHYRVRPHGYAGAYHQHPEFRLTDGTNYIPVDGLQATIDIDETTDIKVSASFFAWSNNGSGGSVVTESLEIAEFELGYKTGTTVTKAASTTRTLRNSGGSDSRASGKQFHQVYYWTNLSPGVYHVGVRVKLIDANKGTANYANIFVTARNLTIKLFPKA
jgi:hypothetical protein